MKPGMSRFAASEIVITQRENVIQTVLTHILVLKCVASSIDDCWMRIMGGVNEHKGVIYRITK